MTPRAHEDTNEDENVDKKSLRVVHGTRTGFEELAKDCVCFANGSGGHILIGIEDHGTQPPAEQRIDSALLPRIRKRMLELTVNVQLIPEVRTAENGGEYIRLTIPRAVGVASTSDGRYFLRVGDTCRPVVGDDVLRLADERPSTPWEAMTSLGVARTAADPAKLKGLTDRLRASDRVKSSVKEKSDAELLAHYGLAVDDVLTNVGVLVLGKAVDRARLGTAPVIQAIKYDEEETKTAKFTWDDYSLSPIELVDAVWQGVPDFRESYELPDGMLRTRIPAYDEPVVRELLVNALVHRPYTQRGDIFLNLHPDRVEVVNAGRLPLGVTPANILHSSRRRNDRLAAVFHDLGLMEREGSGFDLMYERLLSSGRAVPVVKEGVDSVHVTVPRRVVHPGVVGLIANADAQHMLRQREKIALGLLAQVEGLSARELAQRLELSDPEDVRPWISRLLELGLVRQTGRTRATRYYVPPELLRAAKLDGKTTLSRIEPHRLKALIEEDLERFPRSSRSDIHRRIGPEIHYKAVVRALGELVAERRVSHEGERRWRVYWLTARKGQRP